VILNSRLHLQLRLRISGGKPQLPPLRLQGVDKENFPPFQVSIYRRYQYLVIYVVEFWDEKQIRN